MPKIRVMAWNIQNFGTGSHTYGYYKGDDSYLLVEFLNAVVKHFQIDIFAIMEVSPNANASLDNLMFSLNRGLNPKDWCYDYVKGSVEEKLEVKAANAINSPDDLNWGSSSVATRSEGYAVFWRNSQAARFKMLKASQDMSFGTSWVQGYAPPYRPDHALSLNLKGRDFRLIDPPPYVSVEYSFKITKPNETWIDSLYPDVSKYVNPYIPRWQTVRRPAYCLIEVQSGGGERQKICPIMVYHAPSQNQVARPGIYLSALAQELYVHKGIVNDKPSGALAYHDKAIAAGDYNLDAKVDDNWTSSYRSYYRPMNAPNPENTGANCTATYDDQNFDRTTVQVNEYVFGTPTGNPIESDTIADYYHSSIDNLFYRGLAGVRAFVPALPALVMDAGDLTGAPLKIWKNHLERIAYDSVRNKWGVDPNKGPLKRMIIKGKTEYLPIFSNMTNWSLFLRGIRIGRFEGDHDTDTGGARSAAEFIHDFVSDHLPLIVEFDV
jgi:hypothetical protein